MPGRRRRVLAGLAALVAGLVAVGWWLLAPEAARPARFRHDDCRRLDLTDPRTGRPVVGVEDIALAPAGDALILSAHDRRDPARPDGGLYALSLATIGGAAPALRRLDTPREAGAVFRPHGIAVDPATGDLAVINRTVAAAARVEVGPIGPGGWSPAWTVAAPRLCRANDLDFRPDGLAVTLDRADCTASLRDLAPWSNTGAIARLGPDSMRIVETGLRFPNGISGEAVAETRAGAIRLAGGAQAPVPGGPDNLTRDAAGALIAAVHPNLARLFLMRAGVVERAGSRVVRIAGRAPVEILFDDPGGQLVSGATVALLVDGRLVIGSATDRGIVVCGGGA